MEIQLVELHYAQAPICDANVLKARVEAILGETLDMPDRDANTPILLFHLAHAVEYKDAAVPPQTVLLFAHEPIDLDAYAEDIQQSWAWRDCAEILGASQHTILVTEMMALALEPLERLRLFHAVLQAAVELTAPDALVFKHAQQVVVPQDYLAACEDDPILRPGALNVRFYNISDSDGDMLMDTRGLHEIGLHDLQCHFHDLDPNAVARMLLNTAVYLAQNGPVIESGNTIPGLVPDSKWVCQFENALVAPERELLDINPGVGYAAGNRSPSSIEPQE